VDPDPDPTAQINADPCGSGYGSGSETLLKFQLAVYTSLNYFFLGAVQDPHPVHLAGV